MSTFEITISVPSTFSFESRGAEYTFGTTNVPAEMFAAAALHGFKQKLADSLADKAKTEGKEQETLDAIWEAIESGKWNRRGERKPGMSDLDSIMWDLIEKQVRANVMKEGKVSKVKELTEKHLADIETRTAKAFDRPEVIDRVRPAAEQLLAAKRAADATKDMAEI